jgi:hypothetical protein
LKRRVAEIDFPFSTTCPLQISFENVASCASIAMMVSFPLLN